MQHVSDTFLVRNLLFFFLLGYFFGLPLHSYSQDASLGTEVPEIIKKRIDSLEILYKQASVDTVKIKLLNQLSKNYRIIDQYQAFAFAQEALIRAEKIDYINGMGEAYQNMGYISDIQGLYDEAISEYKQGLELYEKNKMPEKTAYYHNGIGIAYWNKKEYPKAKEAFLKALKVHEIANAERSMSVIYNNLGLLDIYMEKYDQALSYLFKALEFKKKYKDQNIIPTYNNIGIAYKYKKNYQKALEYSLESYKNASKLQQKLRIKEASFTLSEIYSETGNYKEAFEYLHIYKAISDTLAKRDKASSITEMKRKYEIHKREEQIEILNQNDQLKTTLYIFSSIFFLFLVIFLVRRAKRRQGFYKILEQKNAEIGTQKGLIEQQNAELMALNENLESLVEERTQKLLESNKELDMYVYRFAHDFRSPISSMLGLASLGEMEVERIETDNANIQNQQGKQSKANIKDLFEKVAFTAQKMDNLLRKLAYLHYASHQIIQKEPFDMDTLTQQLVVPMAEKFKIQDFQVQNTVKKGETIFADKEILKIVLENILENTVMFSSSKRPLEVKMKVLHLPTSGELVFEIQDNGVGIASEQINRVFEMFFRGNELSQGNGLGLYISKKVLGIINGTISIKSTSENGTTLRIAVPSN